LPCVVHAVSAGGVKPNDTKRSTVEIATAGAAIGCIGALVGLAVTGILERLPLWASTMIVVGELVTPFIVYHILKRAKGNG